MDKEFFVENVKALCLQKGIKSTNACKECGVGGSFLSDINRGQVPSVAKVQMLADYLGVTTSELLGEKEKPAANTDKPDWLVLFNSLSPEGQKEVIAFIEFKAVQEKKGGVSHE